MIFERHTKKTIWKTGVLAPGYTRCKYVFQLVSSRYEKGKHIQTSNKSIGDGELMGDPVLETAVLD